MWRHFLNQSPLVWLPETAFMWFKRLSICLFVVVPPWFILLKVWDRFLTAKTPVPWWSYFASGFFGKIDDLSFWIVIAGFLAVWMVFKAWGHLPGMPAGHSECVTKGDGYRTLAFITLGSFTYIVVMYFTKGTLFSELARKERPAQIFEGLTNLALACFFYVCFLFALMTIRRALRLLNEGHQEFSCEHRQKAATLLINAPLAMVTALLGGMFFFPFIKWLGEHLYVWTKSEWWNWSMFKPDPLSEIMFGIMGAFLIVFLYFIPWFWLIRPAVKLPCKHCRLKFNWGTWLWLVTLQQGILALLILIGRSPERSEMLLILRVECEEK